MCWVGSMCRPRNSEIHEEINGFSELTRRALKNKQKKWSRSLFQNNQAKYKDGLQVQEVKLLWFWGIDGY